MSFLNQFGGLLEQYVGGGDGQANPAAQQDFDQVAQHAPPDLLAQGLAGAFRSGNTPPFPQLLAQVFGSAGGQEKAGILNMLIQAVGPSLLSQVLGQGGGGPLGNLGNLGNLAGLLGGGQVTPEQADQISPDAIAAVAAHAEQADPSVIDQVSGLLAGNPGAVGGAFGPEMLTSILSNLGKR